MSAYEQKVDDPPDKNFQYMFVAAEPYETCGFKLQARESRPNQRQIFHLVGSRSQGILGAGHV
jgi:hypothetical protein